MGAAALSIALSLAACGTSDAGSATDSANGIMFTAPKSGDDIAVIKTNKGDITVKFFPEQAPKAVENFLTHARDGYYDGLTFHRVMNDFMIQGGDPKGTGTGGESIWGAPFEDEFAVPLRNVRGALSMANGGANTNGSQFFIVQNTALPADIKTDFETMIAGQDEELGTLENGTVVKVKEYYPKEILQYYVDNGGAYWLDFQHTVFGMVTEGMDIVDAIAVVPVDGADKPIEDVIIESIEVIAVP